ncbi:DUF2187 family protein [Listeria fleischmannii]|uniref:DUF2187 family protein n=1 Tax=Listeria fleischmannii TaxID=1069827 RepID=UPI001626141C|nr:DUF2187 family protein [Listeria fleischmannii]MBC1420185.1 DUF2187 family protein [Listeria fleischmannii]
MSTIYVKKRPLFSRKKAITHQKGRPGDFICFGRHRQLYMGWIEKCRENTVIVRLTPSSAFYFGEDRTVVNYKRFEMVEGSLKTDILRTL